MGRKNRDYSNFRFKELTEEFIHSERDRDMLIRFYVNDETYDQLCSEFQMSLSSVKRILRKGGETVFRHMN